MLHFSSMWGEIQNPPNYLKLGYMKKVKGLLGCPLERDKTHPPPPCGIPPVLQSKHKSECATLTWKKGDVGKELLLATLLWQNN